MWRARLISQRLSRPLHAGIIGLMMSAANETESHFQCQRSAAAENMHDLVPLHLMLPGQSAKIGQIYGDPAAVHRLEELGLRSGVCIEMVRSGEPCIIRLSGKQLCFRDSDTLSVFVRLGETA